MLIPEILKTTSTDQDTSLVRSTYTNAYTFRFQCTEVFLDPAQGQEGCTALTCSTYIGGGGTFVGIPQQNKANNGISGGQPLKFVYQFFER